MLQWRLQEEWQGSRSRHYHYIRSRRLVVRPEVCASAPAAARLRLVYTAVYDPCGSISR